MKIYFREQHLEQLDAACNTPGAGSSFTIVHGRRKVGKTTLVRQYVKLHGGAYISITTQSSKLQLRDITEHLRSSFNEDSYVPVFPDWEEFFTFLFFLSKHRRFTIVMDDFLTLELVEPAGYSILKSVWDRHAASSRLNIIAVIPSGDKGRDVFYDMNAPLYRLPKSALKVQPFTFAEAVRIFRANNSFLSVRQIASVYAVFGGLPQYYAYFERYNLWNKPIDGILQALVYSEYAPLNLEVKQMMYNEFTRANTVYLAILRAIASGEDTLTRIAKTVDIPPTHATKYLYELEKTKGLIQRILPVGTVDASKSKFGRYVIKNYFENFWFRFVYPVIIPMEMGRYDQLLDDLRLKLGKYIQGRLPLIVKNVLGKQLPSEMLHDLTPFTPEELGAMWNRNESIDLVAFNREGKTILFSVFAMNGGVLSGTKLKEKFESVQHFHTHYKDYQTGVVLFTADELDQDAQDYCSEKGINVLNPFTLFDSATAVQEPLYQPIIDLSPEEY